MTSPPIVLHKTPISVIPPFVPFGTLFNEVTRIGSDFDSTVPNSDAQVSPLQHAKTPMKNRNHIKYLPCTEIHTLQSIGLNTMSDDL